MLNRNWRWLTNTSDLTIKQVRPINQVYQLHAVVVESVRECVFEAKVFSYVTIVMRLRSPTSELWQGYFRPFRVAVDGVDADDVGGVGVEALDAVEQNAAGQVVRLKTAVVCVFGWKTERTVNFWFWIIKRLHFSFFSFHWFGGPLYPQVNCCSS